ncbi:helix-turn-helix transcriptional regulator [Kitasatospora sp. NPDC006697]|uniref:helix-turn-helix transcriptional regulator n=1 Tax=Kitasatospora sp. NPDC006697 TaxID=3364020 RepID=UPI0036A7D0F4
MATTEFGELVRHRRGRVTPEAAGLPAGGQRRTAGLRREELALLAGISVDYLTRLEQGRAANPSEQVVESLSRALRLPDPEREQLFHAAGLVPPGHGTVPRHLPPSVQRLLDRLAGTPVAVSDAAWNLLLANPLYTALMGERHGKERNAVWRNFLGRSDGRVRHTPRAQWELDVAMAAALRATARRYPGDQRLGRLIAELRSGSPRFAELWEAGAVGGLLSGGKVVDHPVVGPIALDCDLLSVAGCDLRILVYTAQPGTEAAERLALLEVLGTQSMAE